MNVLETTTFFEITLKYSQMKGKICEELRFEYNSKEIKRNYSRSIKELGLFNGANIKVFSSVKNNINDVEYFNVNFCYDSKQYKIQAVSEMKFSELVTSFYSKAEIKEEKNFTFIFDAKRIPENESSTLRDLKIYDQSKIEVLLIKSIQGAI